MAAASIDRSQTSGSPVRLLNSCPRIRHVHEPEVPLASRTARGPTTRRTSRWGRSATLSLVAFLAWPTLPVPVGEVPATYSAAVRANVAEPDLKPAKIVILVDES